MKKVVSLLFVLILIVSMFAISSVAFAEESDPDLEGIWVDSDGSNVAFTDKTYSGTIKYTDSEEKKQSVSLKGDYEFENGVLKVTHSDDKVTVTIVVSGDNLIVSDTKDEAPLYSKTLSKRFATVDEDAFLALPEMKAVVKNQSMTSNYKFSIEWLKDAAKVNSVFPDITYTLAATDSNPYKLADDSDQVILEYCKPSSNVSGTWDYLSSYTQNININASGWWAFRFVAKDKDGNVLKTTDGKVVKTPRIYVYFTDTDKPEVSDLSSDLKTIQDNGIKVGDTYTIKSSSSALDASDKSSYTLTYIVKKYVKGEWVQVYDSTTRVVEPGYEDGISASGVITMNKEDVLADKQPIYKVIYTVTDAMGFVTDKMGEKQVPIELSLYAKLPEEPVNKVEVWKIILYVIAGLAAVGIVVVLCIKPKQEAPVAAPVAPAAKEESQEESND